MVLERNREISHQSVAEKIEKQLFKASPWEGR